MTEEQLGYLIFEDEDFFATKFAEKLNALGWIFLGRLGTRKEADEFLQSTSFPTREVVAFVDGNLNEKDHSGADGQEIASSLRKRPNVITVGFSNNDNQFGVDLQLGKWAARDEANLIALAEAVRTAFADRRNRE